MVKNELKMIKIDSIHLDEEFYPRMKYSWYTASNYKNNIDSGAKFPPIEVALFNKKYYLIDGRHRIEANKLLKNEFIQAVVHTKLTKKDIFLKAVEMNIKHGQPLSMQDKVKCIDKLQKLDLNDIEVSHILGMSIENVERYKIERITSTVSGESVYLKKTMSHLHNQIVPDNFNQTQEIYNSRQPHILTQAINLIESGNFDMSDQELLKLLDRLKSVVNSIVIPIKVKK